jgi:arylsulfatase A-like enzyme
MKIAVFIPYRLKSSRLDNKPLIKIKGKPVAEHLINRIKRAKLPQQIEKEDVLRFRRKRNENLERRKEEFKFRQEKDKKDFEFKIKNDEVNLKRQLDDSESSLTFFKKNLDKKRKTFDAMIKSIDDSLNRFNQQNKKSLSQKK